jgi:hypothetical protein
MSPTSQADSSIALRIVVVLTALAVILLAVVPLGVRFLRLYQFAEQRERGVVLIEDLRVQCPRGYDCESWDNSVSWLRTAYLNVFSSIDNPTSDSLNRYIDEMERELTPPIPSEAVERLWTRLGSTGTSGTEYISKFDSEFRRSFAPEAGTATPVQKYQSPSESMGEDGP